MALENFKPTLWSDMVLEKYEESAVFAPLMNRSWEGDIRQKGDTVKINSIADFSDGAYSGTVTYTDIDDASLMMLISEDRYVAKNLGDIDKVQATPDLMGAISNAIGQAFLRTQEAYIGGLYTDAGITSGSTGSVTEITSANIISEIGSLAADMDENDVPDDGRVAVVPPWLAQKIVLAGVLRDTDNSDILSAGYIGNFQGFQVYKSNRISHSSTTWYAPMFFRRNDTIALADQLILMESIRRDAVMADGIRALMVYGAKVVRPESLAVLYCSNGSESAI